MKFTIRAMKTSPSAQPLGFFDLSVCGHAQAEEELRVQWLEAKGNPSSPSSEAETTDFADDTDNESIPFVRLCTDRFGEFRAEVPLHPCHPCHPWFSIPVFGLSRLAEWVETTDGHRLGEPTARRAYGSESAGYADSAYGSAASGAEPPARSEAEAMLACLRAPHRQVLMVS